MHSWMLPSDPAGKLVNFFLLCGIFLTWLPLCNAASFIVFCVVAVYFDLPIYLYIHGPALKRLLMVFSLDALSLRHGLDDILQWKICADFSFNIFFYSKQYNNIIIFKYIIINIIIFIQTKCKCEKYLCSSSKF